MLSDQENTELRMRIIRFDHEAKMAEKENQVPESSDCPSLKKKPRLSLSLKKKLPLEECNITISRFAEPVDGNTMAEAVKDVVPQNTEKNNEWAWKHFLDWASARSEKLPSDPVPCDLLSSSDPNLLCKWLCFFVMETRQACGKLYPPKTLYALLCGLLRVARSKGSTLNFLDKSDVRFKDLHLTMDSVCSQLHSKGIGAVRNLLLS